MKRLISACFLILPAVLSAAEDSLRFDELLALARNGDPQAQTDVGVMYRAGTEVAEDFEESVRWLSLAAEQGSAEAQVQLGWNYDLGYGVSADDEEAMKWYRLSAEQGHPRAQWQLGFEYAVGSKVPQNDSESFKWYLAAAEQGYEDAYFQLAVAYDRGEGVPVNHGEAIRWYTAAAELDSPNAFAQSRLGDYYLEGEAVPFDSEEALKWYRSAAEWQVTNAQFALGVMYSAGLGVVPSESEAARWFRLAAEQGHSEAQKFLGGLYESGNGVPRNESEAIKWYRLSAQQGDRDAQMALDSLLAKLGSNSEVFSAAVNQIEPNTESQIVPRNFTNGAVTSIARTTAFMLTIAAIVSMIAGIACARLVRKQLWPNGLFWLSAALLSVFLGVLGAVLQILLLDILSEFVEVLINPISVLRNSFVSFCIIVYFAFSILKMAKIPSNASNDMADGSDDGKNWEQALSEAEGSSKNKALWAKAYSECQGDHSKTKAKYIELRVKQLAKSER